jgi:hypothetical protein
VWGTAVGRGGGMDGVSAAIKTEIDPKFADTGKFETLSAERVLSRSVTSSRKDVEQFFSAESR